MNRKIMVFLIILVGLCAVSHVSASENPGNLTAEGQYDIETQIENVNDEVLTSDDNENRLEAKAVDYRNIQSIIDNSEEGDTIFLNGTYVCDYLVNVDKTVNIESREGAVIKLSDDYKDYNTPFFSVSAPYVRMNNVKFEGGLFHYGGALTWTGDNGEITNCEFKNNIASSADWGIGGALWLTGNHCKVEKCTFISNHAYQHGGAILWSGDDGSIKDSVFIDNKASGNQKGWGGAIMIYANRCVINNCRFINNSCTDYGGAVAVHNQSNKIVGSYFEGNRVMNNMTLKDGQNDLQGGGAVFSTCIGLTVDNCNFTDNHADGSLGGALSLANNNTVTRSYFRQNNALNGLGNDILASSSSQFISNTIILDFNETKAESVYTEIGYGWNVNDLEKNNAFIITKIDSEVKFSAGMVFDYAQSGTIGVSVDGGTLELKNIRVLNQPKAKINLTDENELIVSGLSVGKYTLMVTTTPDERHNAVNATLDITVKKSVATISASKKSVQLKKSTYWSIKLIDAKTKKPISSMKLTLKVYTGKKYVKKYVTTNADGIAKFQTKSLAKGSHKIVISAKHSGYDFNTVTSSVNVVKPTPLIFNAKSITYRDISTLSLLVKKKATKKPINGIKVKLTIYTGKNTKIVILKSKKASGLKGYCAYSTNTLSVGTHKVIIEPYDIKYSGSVTSKMVIKSSAKKVPAATHKI